MLAIHALDFEVGCSLANFELSARRYFDRPNVKWFIGTAAWTLRNFKTLLNGGNEVSGGVAQLQIDCIQSAGNILNPKATILLKTHHVMALRGIITPSGFALIKDASLLLVLLLLSLEFVENCFSFVD